MFLHHTYGRVLVLLCKVYLNFQNSKLLQVCLDSVLEFYGIGLSLVSFKLLSIAIGQKKLTISARPLASCTKLFTKIHFRSVEKYFQPDKRQTVTEPI